MCAVYLQRVWWDEDDQCCGSWINGRGINLLISLDISAQPVPYDLQVVPKEGSPPKLFNRNSKFKKAMKAMLNSIFSGPPLPSGSAVSLKFYVLYPANSRVTYKPDLSNMLKTVEDAATGILYEDDCQICREILIKKQGTRDQWKFRVIYESWDFEPTEWPEDLV